jgi:hypothetical protein
MSRRLLYLILILSFAQIISCQSQKMYTSAISTDNYGNEKKIRPINLIDNPTANSISPKDFQVLLRLYHSGGIVGGLTAGLSDELMFGISYGGQNIIGQGNVIWNQSPGVNIRYKIMNEFLSYQSSYYSLPEIAIGFDSQGYGSYFPDLSRYQIKSKGLYLVVSQNVTIFGGLGFHGGINYSLENKKDKEKDIDFFCGVNFNLDKHISLLWEYDFATNDNSNKALGTGKGYMNAGLRWYFSPNFAIEFSSKNLLNNYREIDGEQVHNANRELKIIYFQSLNFSESK